MEEKKLTDEVVAENATTDEIIKAISYLAEMGEGRGWIDGYKCKVIKFADVLDLIHRLQDENERIQEISKEKSKDYYAVAKTCALQEETIAEQKAEIERLSFYKTVFDKGLAVSLVNMQETIDKQKAEIERLTEENAILKGNPPLFVGRSSGKTIRAKLLAFDRMKEQNAELQKRVDELKARDMSEMRALFKAETDRLIEKAHQKTVKDTAKEIYRKSEKKAHFKDGGHYDRDRYLLDMADLKEILKGYGVEVE